MKKIFLSILFLIIWFSSYSVQAEQDIRLSYGSYLSENGVDNTVWLKYFDNSLYIGVNTTFLYPSPVVTHSSQEWKWKIFVFDVTRKKMNRQIVLDGELLDFDVKNNFIYVVTTQSTQILTLNGLSVLSKPNAIKVSADTRGNYVLLNANNEIFFYGPNHALQFQQKITKTSLEDILIDEISGRVFIVGYDDKTIAWKLISVAFLYAYDYQGNYKYKLFDFSWSEMTSYTASTKLYSLSLGSDKKLYILWETQGKDTIFKYNGTTLSGNQKYTPKDVFSELPENQALVAYFARVHPETGVIETSNFALPRGVNWEGASFQIKDGNISTTQNGIIMISWESEFSFPWRENVRINGTKIGTFLQWDGVLQWYAGDFLTRYFSVSFGKDLGAHTQINDVISVWGNQIVALGSVLSGSIFTTENTIEKKTNDKNAFLVVFSFETMTQNKSSTSWNSSSNTTSTSQKPVSQISSAAKYDEYIKTALVNPNISAREKLEKYIHPNYYTPKNTKAAKAYILLSWKFNEKKNMLLRSKRAITQADLDIFRNYTISLYNLIYAIDSKKPTSELKKLAKYFSQDYKNVMNIK